MVFSFWHGPIGALERACMLSCARQGHALQLFTFNPDLPVPPGVTVRDARERLPGIEPFAYRMGAGAGSFSAYSNLFRYRVLADEPATWLDLDVILLRPLPDHPFLAAYEYAPEVNGAVLRSLADNLSWFSGLFDEANALRDGSPYGSLGPKLISRHLGKLESASSLLLKSSAFYPILWRDVHKMLLPEHADECRAKCADSCAVHGYNEVLRRLGFPRQLMPPAGSFLRQLYDDLGLTGFGEASVEETRRWMEGSRLGATYRHCAAGWQVWTDGRASVARSLRASLKMFLHLRSGRFPGEVEI